MKRFAGLLLLVVVSGAFGVAGAQAVQRLDTIKSQEELTKTVAALDKELFDAYNTCNLDKLGTLVAGDLEFLPRQDRACGGQAAVSRRN